MSGDAGSRPHAYDGLNRRITRTIGSDDAIHEYYTDSAGGTGFQPVSSWQSIESRPGGESSTQGVSLFVFGIRYIGDIVMRQRDANASGRPAYSRLIGSHFFPVLRNRCLNRLLH